jgi:hypothetical protein
MKISDVLAVEVPGQTIPSPPSNLIWQLIGAAIIIAFLVWVGGKIHKRLFAVVAIAGVILLVVIYLRNGGSLPMGDGAGA